MIHAVEEGSYIYPEMPSLSLEFFEQLKLSEAPNGCILLPGNFQYWQPSRWTEVSERGGKREHCGTISNKIEEPIHFSGPYPVAPSTISPEEEKKEEPRQSVPEETKGSAMQSPP